MSEAAVGAVASGGMTAGRLLREARQAQGLHIAALASAIKVAPLKLELLESDRLGELPDATFTRALAQTVCRSLKVDPRPILALLPPPSGYRLEQVGEGLNTPFHERPARLVPNDWTSVSKPAVWGPVLVLLAAGAVYLVPAGWLPSSLTLQRPAPDAGAPAERTPTAAPAVPVDAVSPIAATPTVPEPAVVNSGATAERAGTVPAATAVAPVPAAGLQTTGAALPADSSKAPVPALAPKLLQVHTLADSWVEVVDARGRPLLSRLVRSGETVDVDGVPPFKLRIGNASGTEIVFRGQALALAPFTRDNLARLELK